MSANSEFFVDKQDQQVVTTGSTKLHSGSTRKEDIGARNFLPKNPNNKETRKKAK